MFVDYWNLQLGAGEKLGRNFMPDWRRIPQWLGVAAVRLAVGDPALRLRMDGLNAYMSYNPASAADRKCKTWASNFLDRVPSVQVICKERKPRYAPQCQESYDYAVLVSSDADYVPAVELLSSKWRRIIHIGFPPKGMSLAKTCWASLDLAPYLKSLER